MPRMLLAILASILLSAKAPAERPAPDFTLPTAGGSISLHDLRGKVVYVDFWASWCGPCRQSFPWMRSMADKHGREGLAVVAINLDKSREAAARFLQQHPVPFTVAFDPAGRTAEQFEVDAMPSSFVVGRDGNIVFVHQGFQESTARRLEAQIEEALSK